MDELKSSLIDIDLVSTPLIVMEPRGKVIFINQYVPELLHCTKDSLLNRSWFAQQQSKKEKTIARQFFKKILNQGYGKQVITKETEQGIYITEWRYAIIKNNKGKVLRVVGSGEDITEKVLLRKKLIEMQKEYKKDILATMVEAVERERREIAYELHDGVNQVLTVCKLLLEREREAGNNSMLVLKTTEHIQKVINDIRNLAHNLNPSDLGSEGLLAEAKAMVEKIGVATSIEIRLKVKGKNFLKLLPQHNALSLFRIMQEALNNILKHAGASTIRMQLEGSAKGVDLEIEDDGSGFDNKKWKGFGLKNIYARAEVMGGAAHISSDPGKGTLISVFVPLENTTCDRKVDYSSKEPV